MISFEVEVPEVDPRDIDVEKIIEEEMNRAALETKIAMQEASPVATGTLRNSWQVDPAKKTNAGMSVQVYSNEVSAPVMNDGAKFRKPPPSKNLQGWVRSKLGYHKAEEVEEVAGRISVGLFKKGIRARHVFDNALESVRSKVDAIMERMGHRILEKK